MKTVELFTERFVSAIARRRVYQLRQCLMYIHLFWRGRVYSQQLLYEKCSDSCNDYYCKITKQTAFAYSYVVTCISTASLIRNSFVPVNRLQYTNCTDKAKYQTLYLAFSQKRKNSKMKYTPERVLESFTAPWLLYLPPDLILKLRIFATHSISACVFSKILSVSSITVLCSLLRLAFPVGAYCSL